MTVVLLILKIIGIIFLVILAVFLLLALCVLFVPVRYRIDGSYHGELQLRARAGWLFRVVWLGLDVTPERSHWYLRIFGIKKNLTKADNTKDFEDTRKDNAKKRGEPTDPAEQSAEMPEGELTAQSVPEDSLGQEEDFGVSGGGFTRFYQKFLNWVQKFRDLFTGIRQAVVNIRAASDRIAKLVGDDSNRQAFQFFTAQVFELLGKIAPKKLKLDLVYSTGSPDTTGELLGVLALFPAAYKNRWNVVPDFTAEQFYADAQFDVKGRVFLYQILRIGLRVIRDKNCRRLYHQFQRR